jgi:hypothetical protein
VYKLLIIAASATCPAVVVTRAVIIIPVMLNSVAANEYFIALSLKPAIDANSVNYDIAYATYNDSIVAIDPGKY